MKKNNYFKIVVNIPNRELFSKIQHNILYEDVEMFFFPNLAEIETFIQKIEPHIFLTYTNQKILENGEVTRLLKSDAFENTWIIFIVSPNVNPEHLKSLSEIKKSLVLLDGTSSDVIIYNIKSILDQEKKYHRNFLKQAYSANLLEVSKIINQEDSIGDVFGRLIHFLPKILPYDYWALFTIEPELNKIDNFVQFIPPHRRNLAILTPNLEKLAEVWMKKHGNFHIRISEDPQLFRKLGEWGWGIKQLYFSPIKIDKIRLGGMVLGNANESDVTEKDAAFLNEINELLAQKIYHIFRWEKGDKGLDDFAEQLIYNRFSEESILQLSCRKINDIAKAENTIFWQINRGFGFLFPKFSYARENRTYWKSLEKNMLFLRKDQHLNVQVSTENISLLENVTENSNFDESTLKIFEKLEYHHLLIAPIRIHNDEIGIFIANRMGKETPFTNWEVDQVTQLLDKIQKVLEDTHLVKEANLKLKQLTRIFELGNELKLDQDFDDILAHISKSIRKTLGWNDVVILRNDSFKRVFKPIHKIGFDKKEELPIDILSSLDYQVFNKFLVNCKKISHSYFYDSHPININGNGMGYLDEMITEWHNQDLVIIPVETRKKMLGFLIVHDPVDRLKPDEDKVVSLEYFANQTAVAIENAILYENLLASEERYRSLAETMTLALVTCSTEGKILYVNPAFERLVGRNKKELSKKPLMNFFAPTVQDKFRNIVAEIMHPRTEGKENVENVELELISQDDEAVPVSTFAFPFYQQRQKTGFFLVLNDLRVIKKLEQLKADFNSMIVHDLRSPMNVIQGFIELIRTRVVGEINTEQEELLDIAKENVKKVLSLIDNFLVASKMEVGKFSIDPKINELNSLIENISDNHQVMLKNKNITVETQLNPNLPLLFFDSLRIEQVLNNLLSNAIKFTPAGGKIMISTELFKKEIKSEYKMYARIGVHDSGPGIPPEKLNYVFEKYEQVDSELSLKSAGTGLGLSICQEIVGLHGGEIWVESELKKGSHFYFTLPIEPSIEKFVK